MKKILIVLLASVISLTCPAGATAADVDGGLPELTIDMAVEKAKKYSNSLIAVNENKKVIEEDIKRAGLITETLAMSGGSVTIASDSAYNSYLTSAKSQLNLISNEYDREKQEDLIELTVKKLFASIISAQNDLKQSNESLIYDKSQLEIEKVRLELGLISQSAYNTQRDAYEKSVKSGGDTAKLVETAFEDLNYYMNEDPEKRYSLLMDMEYEPLGEIDLDYHITYCQDKSADILQKRQDLELAELDAKVYTESSSSLLSRTNKVNQASRALGEAKKSIDEKIRKSYKTIIDFEEQLAQNEREKEGIVYNVNIKEVQRKNGLITELELQKAMFELKDNEYKRQNIIISHYVEKLSFEKPYV